MHRRTVLLLALLVVAAIGTPLIRMGAPVTQVLTAPVDGPPTQRPTAASEQEWIIEDVVGAIAGITLPTTTTASPEISARPQTSSTREDSPSYVLTITGIDGEVPFTIADHVWSPKTFTTVVTRLLAAPGAPRQVDARDRVDFGVRAALTDLRVEVLLDQNEKLSAALQRNLMSADAHESAALLIGALALRESVGLFSDVRPALSRMAAHLAIADALRAGDEPSTDGLCAMTILTALAGLDRQAMDLVTRLDRRAASDADRAWSRALRLRITGDWRVTRSTDTLLEKLEFARAVRERLGIDRFLDYLDTLPASELADWHRIAFDNQFNIEAGHRFTDVNVERDLQESRIVWSRLHAGQRIDRAELISALNERAAASPVRGAGDTRVVQVLDWGTWAAFEQRQLCMSLVSISTHLWGLGAYGAQREWNDSQNASFGRLTLFPLVLRWGAPNAKIYVAAMTGARALVDHSPQLVTAAEWDFLLTKSGIQGVEVTFPIEVSWFTPAVPTGTAFDLENRSLRFGCPRPPTRAQAALWAREQPYEHWTVWANEYLALDRGKPSLLVIQRAFGPLLGYDYSALHKMIDFIDMTDRERIAFADRLCAIAPADCNRFAELLLVSSRETEALAAYERWIAKARDTVGVSNHVTWIVRYYLDHGRRDQAERIAKLAGDTGSAAGLEILGEVLERTGRYDEAEQTYKDIAERYANNTTTLGTFYMRQALRTQNKSYEVKAGELLRVTFPGGLQPVAMHALPVIPSDGVQIVPTGPRVTKTGLRPGDVVIGVDEWRVHNSDQYTIASRLRFTPEVTLTVWRNNRYQQLHTTVPERWFGSLIETYTAPPAQR